MSYIICQMQISQHQQPRPSADKEPSHESQYIRQHFANILPKCLAEVIEKRPYDPIEYIAQWIYKHRENEIRNKKVQIL